MADSTDHPNSEQRTYWNEAGGKRWAAAQEELDRRIEPYGLAAMDAARVAPGEDVIDVGCGCGATSVELARRVGETGSVLGLDLSEPMLEVARSRGAPPNVRFEAGDAQVHPLAPASADLVYSRFGVMFFADPPAAFANFRRALRPEGRVAFICWQGLQKNPWMALPMSVVAQHVEAAPPPPPGSPGPLAFADPDHVRGILARAGLVDVGIEPFEHPMVLGGSVDRAVEFILDLGPTARMLQDAPEDARIRAAEALREALRPFAGNDGVALGSAAWVVTARAG